MKFVSLYLKNYIGIYNGMGLFEITIDFNKCRNRILIIRGDNGSGKSTLINAMNVFPDSNDSFIPNKCAIKEIILNTNNIFYKLRFIHDVKQNGDRETTKAYISKSVNDTPAELNPNGNVSSFKDILYEELSLDPNFISLSQLSNDDRGLADKRPAERKRFVNSIINSLDVYNDIYKSLSKKASSYKNMIDNVIGKLGAIGNIDSLNSNIVAIESKLSSLRSKRDDLISDLAKYKAQIELLDPGGVIQLEKNTLYSKSLEITSSINKIKNIIKKLIHIDNIESIDISKELDIIKDKIEKLRISNQIDRVSMEELINSKERESLELSRKTHQLEELNDGKNYEEIKSQRDLNKSQLEEIESVFKNKVGIRDILSITKDEYTLAINTINELNEQINLFKSEYDFDVISQIVSLFSSNILETYDNTNLNNTINEDINRLNYLNEEKINILAKMDLLDQLKLRPETCVDNECKFIKDALSFSNTKPTERLTKINEEIECLNQSIKSNKIILEKQENFNNAINRFYSIIRQVDKNGGILSKIPNGEIFRDKISFINGLLNGYSFEYKKDIQELINISNLFDIYEQTLKSYNVLNESIKEYNNKFIIIDSINKDIQSINECLNELYKKIEPIKDNVLNREKEIENLKVIESSYLAAKDQFTILYNLTAELSDINNKILENDNKMITINNCLSSISSLQEQINSINTNIAQLTIDRDKISHSIQLVNDYIKEKAELEENYKYIETIRYYSSPTTGIQLIFMQLYMGKVIDLANQLLKLLFGGEYVIQPFIINDSEFRIPCLGSGYLNDDISSMSSSQVSMISMILSFSLLYNSSTSYNIIKLDEIDGPLDYNNRVYFIDVLNKIMDIMGTEQCIIISHNSELQVDDADIILLKHDMNNNDYGRGNIIWKY